MARLPLGPSLCTAVMRSGMSLSPRACSRAPWVFGAALHGATTRAVVTVMRLTAPVFSRISVCFSVGVIVDLPAILGTTQT